MTGDETSRAYSAVLVAMVSISFASIFIKWSDSSPFVIAFYRLIFTCALLTPFILWSRGFSELRQLRVSEWTLIALSAVALAFHFGLWIVSLSLTLVSTSVILVTAHPMFVAGMSHFLLREKVRRAAAIGIVIAFSGVCVISIADYGEASDTLFGDLLAFLGGLCAGIYFLSGRRARQRISLGPYVFSVYLFSALMLLIAAVLVGDTLIVLEGRELSLFLLLAIVPTILGHTMFNYALKKVPAHIVSTSVLGEPVGASILAFLLLPEETPGPWIIIGGALVIMGLYIVLSRGRTDKIKDGRE
ncbi:MAG: EamA family transporter [Methanobacteriota archaeon]|nr:MAG: EamA family transporter [Euryarchaeota archaeon]